MSAYSFDDQFFQPALLNASVASPNANKNWELGGVNAADVNSTLGSNGGNVLACAGASGDQMIVSPHQDTDQTTLNSLAWDVRRQPISLRFDYRSAGPGATIVTALDNTTHCFGIRPTISGAAAFDETTDDFKVILRAVRGSPPFITNPTYQLVVSNEGTDTVIDTGVIYAVGIHYSWLLQVSASGVVSLRGGAISLQPAGSPIQNPGAAPDQVLNVGIVNYPAVSTATLTLTAGDQISPNNLGTPFYGLQADAAISPRTTLLRMAGQCRFTD